MADKQLETLVEKIAAAKKSAEVNLGGLEHLPTFPGLKIAKGTAQKALVGLRKEFDTLMMDRISVILVQGPDDKAGEFAGIALEEGDAFSLDGNALYKEVASKVKMALTSQKTFSTTQYMHMCAAIKEVAEKMGVDRIEFPAHVPQVTIKDEAALLSHVKNLMLKKYHHGLSARYLQNKALEKAFDGRYTQSIVPVVITNVTGEEAAALSRLLFTGKNVVADLNQDKPTKSFVIKNFVALKNLRKGSTPEVKTKEEVKPNPEVTNQTNESKEENNG